jgi:cytochrome o ubiquinol oxidase subunit II
LEPSASWQHGVLDPQGPVGAAERTILANATVIMLAVIVPVILLTLGFAWWFRASNPHAKRKLDWAYSGPIEVTVWSIPMLVILFLGGIAWVGAHDLDPHAPLAGETKPLDVQVVSLDWKWLFIYPSEGLASVDQLVVPAGVPLRLRLTSATVMNSFFVPQLGSQIYTMPGMKTTLNLRADHPGTYPGLSAQFSGDGFSDMRFNIVALAPDDFRAWIARTRAEPGDRLDQMHYGQLESAKRTKSPFTYSAVEPQLFETILQLSAPKKSSVPGATAAPPAGVTASASMPMAITN